MSEVEHVLAVNNKLGEGPVWCSEEQALYWVDIESNCFYRMYPTSMKYEVFEVGLPIGVLALRVSGGLIMATKSGFAFWDTQQGLRLIADPEAHKPHTRFNDGAVDCQGRFWAGTMCGLPEMCEEPEGCLYRFDPDGSIHTPDEHGIPDGLAVDSEGFIWSARWGGWKITRYDPTGKAEREIQLPVQYPTSCAFGGERLDELYITSAWTALSEEQKKKQPGAGDLFRIKTDLIGLVRSKFVG